MTHPFSRLVLAFVVVLTAAAFSGCNGDPHVSVSGKVTRNGGPWPVKGNIYFACKDPAPGFDMEMSSSVINEDGSYSARLLPGTYNINLEMWEVPPSMENPAAQKSFIPDKYKSTAGSGFQIEVPVGSGAFKKDFDVPTM